MKCTRGSFLLGRATIPKRLCTRIIGFATMLTLSFCCRGKPLPRDWVPYLPSANVFLTESPYLKKRSNSRKPTTSLPSFSPSSHGSHTHIAERGESNRRLTLPIERLRCRANMASGATRRGHYIYLAISTSALGRLA